jgi:hypothetical protein
MRALMMRHVAQWRERGLADSRTRPQRRGCVTREPRGPRFSDRMPVVSTGPKETMSFSVNSKIFKQFELIRSKDRLRRLKFFK